MPDLDASITGYVAGDDLVIRRTITSLPDAIAAAWITLKHRAGQPDDDAVIQKMISETEVLGVGHIEDDGGLGVNGILRFDFAQADTLAMKTAEYVYDIQIKLDNGAVYTVEKGTIQLTAGVTDSTT